MTNDLVFCCKNIWCRSVTVRRCKPNATCLSHAYVVRRDGSVHNTPEGFLISWIVFSNIAVKYKTIRKENGIKKRAYCQASYTMYIHVHI